MRVLCVDDDPVSLEVAANAARSVDPDGTTLTATSAEEAQGLLDDVDLLITDLVLPGRSGLELMVEAQARCPGVDAVVITGHGAVDTAIDAVRKGARDYLEKPVGVERLCEMVRAVRETRRRRSDCSVLLAVAAPHVRRRLSLALGARGLRVSEAVNGTDALRQMSKQLPGTLVVVNRLGDESGYELVRQLGETPTGRSLPIVFLVDQPEIVHTLQSEPLRPSVVPVVQYASVDALVEVITRARMLALSEPGVKATLPATPLVATDAVKSLERAFETFERVIDLFRSNRLPGPLMPALLTAVRELLADENVSFKQIGTFVEQHQILAARLLALANSAFYSVGSRIASVTQALNRIGMQQAEALLHAAAALSYVVGKDPTLRKMIIEELTHPFMVALVADALARRARFDHVRQLFAAAILYNVGTTFLFYTVALEHQRGAITTLDHGALRTMAANRARDLNHLVCEGLRLPREVELVYGFGPGDVEGAQENRIVRYIHQAMWVADRVLGGAATVQLDVEAEIVGLDAAAVEHVNEALPKIQTLLAAYRD